MDPFDPKKSHNRAKIAATNNIPNSGNTDDEDLDLEVSHSIGLYTNDYLQ